MCIPCLVPSVNPLDPVRLSLVQKRYVHATDATVNPQFSRTVRCHEVDLRWVYDGRVVAAPDGYYDLAPLNSPSAVEHVHHLATSGG